MPHDNQPEALVAERIRSRLGEAEESQLAHRTRVDSRAAWTNLGEAESKKSWLPVPRLPAPRSTCDAPGIRLNRRAS
jgi:hypothetical protein